MTARDLIRASLRVIGAVATGETPPAEELNDGLQALNLMLDGWFGRKTMVYAVTRESFALTVGKGSYTIGSGGDFDTVRPVRIESALLRDTSNIDHQVKVYSREEYNRVSSKTAQGRPTELYFHPAYPAATVYLDSVPSAAYTLHLDSWKPFTKFTGLDTEVTLPPAYERALKFNLAVETAPEYGASIPAEVFGLAEESKRDVESLNASLEVTPARFDDVPGEYETYDIHNG